MDYVGLKYQLRQMLRIKVVSGGFIGYFGGPAFLMPSFWSMLLCMASSLSLGELVPSIAKFVDAMRDFHMVFETIILDRDFIFSLFFTLLDESAEWSEFTNRFG